MNSNSLDSRPSRVAADLAVRAVLSAILIGALSTFVRSFAVTDADLAVRGSATTPALAVVLIALAALAAAWPLISRAYVVTTPDDPFTHDISVHETGKLCIRATATFTAFLAIGVAPADPRVAAGAMITLAVTTIGLYILADQRLRLEAAISLFAVVLLMPDFGPGSGYLWFALGGLSIALLVVSAASAVRGRARSTRSQTAIYPAGRAILRSTPAGPGAEGDR